MSKSCTALKFFFSFLLIWVADASFFAEDLHLPSWFTHEMQNIHVPSLKEIPWYLPTSFVNNLPFNDILVLYISACLSRSKLSPTNLLSTKEEEKSLASTTMTPMQTKALAVDFKETDKQFELDVDFPGMKKEEISIKTDGNILTISGERKFSKEKDEGKYHKVERFVKSCAFIQHIT
jgi:hypothetical protein